MNEFFFAEIFYQFFAQAPDFTLPYYKVKKISDYLLSREIEECERYKVKQSLHLLLYLGLIDRTILKGKVVFRLTKSVIISGENRSIFINNSLEALDSKYRALNYAIKNNEDSNCGSNSIENFNPLNILRAIPNIQSIIRKRFKDCNEQKEDFKLLNKWEIGHHNKWIKVKDFDFDNSLYRVYPFNQSYYRYCIILNSKHYDFQIDDVLALNLVKNYLGNLAGIIPFEFDVITGILKENFPLLEPIRKVLFTQHILTTGELPEDKTYIIDKKILKELKRIYI